MAKPKKGKGGAAAPVATKKCTCDHPYNCECGNRPERPSRGHRWDPESQTWGGKGHKQKGASGQTAQIAQAATTTQVGKTQIAQWQRLPSTLLKEYCQREKRRPPKFKNISKTPGKFLCRVILPDPKDVADKDLFFVPAKGVDNEEQAQEEACILALLSQTPSLPHERKLPEPYKTTWLHAMENTKQQAAKDNTNKKKAAKEDAVDGDQKPSANHNNNNNSTQNSGSGSGNSGAKASTSLTLGKTYTSKADRQKQIDAKRIERNKRIRKHEAIRLANQHHPVFLAAHLRQQIQNLLRGDMDSDSVPGLLDLEEEDDDANTNDDLDDGQIYVLERLRHEGFTQRQVRTALEKTSTSAHVQEDQWETLYEDCLQWLCIHLDEDQLPEGFDPRGGTLDVIVATAATNTTSNSSGVAATRNDKDENITPAVKTFASNHGIRIPDAKFVLEQAQAQNVGPKDAFWQELQKIAGVTLETATEGDDNRDDNLEMLQEEMEALEAIFPSEFTSTKNDNETILTIKVTDVDSKDMTLQVVVENGVYPQAYPKRLLIFGSWPAKTSKCGVWMHVETIKFMSELDLGAPQIFEIYGHVQSLFHSIIAGDTVAEPLSLVPGNKNNTNNNGSAPSKSQPSKAEPPSSQKGQASMNHGNPPKNRPPPRKRPRERSTFWSTPPNKTPPATAFPKIGMAMDKARKSLPAFKARADFLAAMSKAEKGGRVVLVTGDTGCGKTTQIPQFILEEAAGDVKIVVAQPRRLAATGVATRVANERGEDEAGRESVGYVVRGDNAMCAKTRLVFCTTGVLLRQLQSEGALENITHIIVDEVHERHLDTDVLLGFLKLTLKDFPKLKVVLMSATLDADKFAGYWGSKTPRIHIPGRTFPVTDYFLEDVLSATGYIPPKNKNKKKRWQGNNNQRPKKSNPWADSERSDDEDGDDDGADDNDDGGASNSGPGGAGHSIPIDDLVKRVDESDLDYDLLANLVRYLVMNKGPEDDGSILVFLAGAPEINNATEAVKRIGRNLQIHILPLHGGLQPKDQRLVFQPTRNGLTKVILSTNVAETSITIPDCTIVVDTCREKESSYDPVNRMPLLLEQFASQASLKQRRGRAGRVREGVCYKLISSGTYNKLKEHGDPEIRRCALDQTLLSLLFLGVERGSGTFTRTLMDPPSQDSVDSAILSLRKLGAVASGEAPGEVCLTPLGMHLAGIPAPPSVGKLLIMGSILGCRQAALAMAASMSTGRSPFLRVDQPFKRRGDEEKTSFEDMKKERIISERKALFAKVGNSDHSLLVAAYMQWDQTGTGGGERKRLCDSLGLSFNGMRDIAQLVKQYDSSLRAAGYAASKEADRNSNSWMIIRACAVAALAPSQLVRVQRPSAKYVETVEGAMEKDGVAKELKFFIRGSVEDQQAALNAHNNKNEERVFVHPSSFAFSVGSYYCPWLVYHSMVRTSKPFLRDVSECSAYALLLFNDLEVQAKEGVIVIDNWVKLAAKARIGSLVGGLRSRVDSLLTKKIDDPSFELAGTSEMKLVVKLLVTDGHG